MKFKDQICTIVRDELNHIYTEPPRQIGGGLDLGWFCREHALHLHSVAKLLGEQSKIIVGDFVIALSNGSSYTSIDDDSDHAWCSVGNVSPVDFSASTKYLARGEEDIGAVWGCDLSQGRFNVSNLDSDEIQSVKCRAEELKQDMIYFPKEEFDFHPIELLENPYQFLFKPPRGHPTFMEIWGLDVFFQITWHCLRLARREVKPFNSYRDPKSTVRAIVKFNKGAKKEICSRYEELQRFR